MQDEQQLDFVTHKCESHSSTPPQHPFGVVLNQMRKKSQQLITDFVKEIILTIEGRIRDDLQFNKVMGVILHKNQQGEYGIFYHQIEQTFRNGIARKQQNEQTWTLYTMKIDLCVLDCSEVKQALFNMHIFMREHQELQYVIFLVKNITNLDSENVLLFQKMNNPQKFTIIIPTFNTDIHHFNVRGSRCEYQQHKFYDPKELFCNFFYQCTISKSIKAYLPAESLRLISDLDYYPISYMQNCRRLKFCMQRFLTHYRKQVQFVDFAQLINCIDLSVKRRLKNHWGYKTPHQKLLKIILKDGQNYYIPDNGIAIQLVQQAVSGHSLSQVQFLDSIRQSIISKLAKNKRFQGYIAILQDQELKDNTMLPRKKKTRSDLLQIDPKKNITPKNLLQNQITRIIRMETDLVRRQSRQVQWQDIKFQLRIRPPIPQLIVSSFRKDKNYSELLDQILESYSQPLTKYLNLFEKDNLGQAIYRLKCLQLSGIISFSKKSIKPIIYNNFFEKASFYRQ